MSIRVFENFVYLFKKQIDRNRIRYRLHLGVGIIESITLKHMRSCIRIIYYEMVSG